MIKGNAAFKIWEEIKKAKKILLALHVSPDPDSVASTLAMDLVLRQLKKKTEIISFSLIPPAMAILPGMEKVEIADFGKKDLKKYDLFIALDSAQPRMVTRSSYPQKFPAGFKVINIDHHLTNDRFGDINLVAYESSTAEVLYHLFEFWGIKIDQQVASLLLEGIVVDSGCFQYSLTTTETLRVGAELIDQGASLSEIVRRNFRSYSLLTLKYWGRVLDNMRMDESGLFVWSKISREEVAQLGIDPTEIGWAATLFAPIVDGTEFGIILNEENGQVRGGMRSRVDFDVAKIAEELGGGGHKHSAGFSLALSLDEAEKKVLEVARKAVNNLKFEI